MKKVILKFSDDEYETVKSCFAQNHKLDYVFSSAIFFHQRNGVQITVTPGQLENLMDGLFESGRAKGTINSVYTNFGRKVDSIINRLISEFYG